MSSLEIRSATTADLPFITEIYEHAVRFGTATFELIPPDLAEMTRRFRALMDGGFPYLVAALDGSVAGYAYASPYRPRPAYRFTVENSVYLQPAVHRRGIGLQLLQRLIDECEPRGYRQMIAVIGDSANAGSVGVHSELRLPDDRHAPQCWLQVRPLARHRDDAAPAWRRRQNAASRPSKSALNHCEFAVDHQQHTVEFVAAPQDQAGRGNHAVDALLARKPRIFFDR